MYQFDTRSPFPPGSPLCRIGNAASKQFAQDSPWFVVFAEIIGMDRNRIHRKAIVKSASVSPRFHANKL